MKELVSLGQKSIEVQLSEMTVKELWEHIDDVNNKFAELGVKISISEMVYGAQAHGYRYEDRRYDAGGVVVTPMNCLATLVWSQPELKKLDSETFSSLLTTVSRISMAVDSLFLKQGGFTWPDKYMRKPQLKTSV